MRALAALLLALATIGWATIAWPGLLLVPGLTPYEYSLSAGIAFAIIFLVMPVALAMSWSLVLQRRLPTRRQFRNAGIAIVAIAALAAIAIPVAYAIGWLVNNTTL
jgi:hypothetical protein